MIAFPGYLPGFRPMKLTPFMRRMLFNLNAGRWPFEGIPDGWCGLTVRRLYRSGFLELPGPFRLTAAGRAVQPGILKGP